jgi:hypothetical protein
MKLEDQPIEFKNRLERLPIGVETEAMIFTKHTARQYEQN